MDLKNVPVSLCFVFLSISFLMIPCTCDPTCEPAEEGTEHQINCTIPLYISYSDMFNVEWRMRNEYNKAELVAECFSETDCNILRPSDVQVSFDNDSSILTIMDVSRTKPFNVETDWTCTWVGYGTTDACTPLQVFARPIGVECEYVGEVGGNDFTFRCVVEKVYPRAKCELQRTYELNNQYWRQENLGVRYKHTVVNEDPIYYSSECKLTFPFYEIPYDGPFFKVLVYPDVERGQEYGVDSVIWDLTLEEVGEFDNTTDTVVDNTATTTTEPNNKDDDDDDDDEEIIIPLTICLGISVTMTIVLGIVVAVVVCRNKSTKRTSRSAKDQPMTSSGPVPENYDHMELSNQRQGSVNEGYICQDEHRIRDSNVYEN